MTGFGATSPLVDGCGEGPLSTQPGHSRWGRHQRRPTKTPIIPRPEEICISTTGQQGGNVRSLAPGTDPTRHPPVGSARPRSRLSRLPLATARSDPTKPAGGKICRCFGAPDSLPSSAGPHLCPSLPRPMTALPHDPAGAPTAAARGGKICRCFGDRFILAFDGGGRDPRIAVRGERVVCRVIGRPDIRGRSA
jgi:hypothetical protein